MTGIGANVSCPASQATRSSSTAAAASSGFGVRHRQAGVQHEIQAGVGDRVGQRGVDRGQRGGAAVGQEVAGHVERVAYLGEWRQVLGDRGGGRF